MGEGTYVWRKTRPPGKGWQLVAVKDGGYWMDKLWYRAEPVSR